MRAVPSARAPGVAAEAGEPPVEPPGLTGARAPRLRVLIVTAPVGEGHVAAARALSRSLAAGDEGVEVIVLDALPSLPRLLARVLKDLYRWQLRTAPWLFGLLFGALRRSRALRAVVNLGLSLLGSRALLRLARANDPDIVVSTYPLLTTILGSLRRRGRLTVPVCAPITDFAGLEFWVHPGVDLHLVMHDSLLPTVERIAGRGSAKRSAPLVAPEFLQPRSRTEARRGLGLPLGVPIVVVSGGGWGIGDIPGAVSTALQFPDAFVVCLTGRNQPVRERMESAFGQNGRVAVLGFTDRMSDLLAAADVLVHSTGGVTCLEALARGCPIVAYGAPAGHAPLLAKAMAALGLVRRAGSQAELLAALRVAIADGSGVTLDHGASASALVLGVRPRTGVDSRRHPGFFVRPAVLAGVLLTALVSAFSFVLAPELTSLTSMPTYPSQVGRVVREPAPALIHVARTLAERRVQASAALERPLTGLGASVLQASQLVPFPQLGSSDLPGGLETGHRLARGLGAGWLGRRLLFLTASSSQLAAAVPQK